MFVVGTALRRLGSFVSRCALGRDTSGPHRRETLADAPPAGWSSLEALEPRLLLDADLSVTVFTAPAANERGDLFTVDWTVENVGDTTTATWWYDALYITTDPNDVTTAGVAKQLFSEWHSDTLDAGQSYSVRGT